MESDAIAGYIVSALNCGTPSCVCELLLVWEYPLPIPELGHQNPFYGYPSPELLQVWLPSRAGTAQIRLGGRWQAGNLRGKGLETHHDGLFEASAPYPVSTPGPSALILIPFTALSPQPLASPAP